MARAWTFFTNFTAGELSPQMAARLDVQRYLNGARVMENAVSLPWGGADRRPGTRFVVEVKNSAKRTELYPFEFSTEQAYGLELGDGYIRFLKDDGQIVVADTDAAIANGTFDSGIASWTDQSTGSGAISHDATNNRMQLDPGGATASDVAIAEQSVSTSDTGTLHVLAFEVFGKAGDAVEMQIGTSSGGAQLKANAEYQVGTHLVAFTPTASPFHVQFLVRGTTLNKALTIDNVSLLDDQALELAAPWAQADLFDADDDRARVQITQSADVLYLFHADYATRKLLRFGDTTWSLVEVDWIDGPYGEENTDSGKTLAPSATTGVGITITAAGHEPFAATDVGRLVRIKVSSAWGYARITAFTDSQNVTADVLADFDGSTASATWRLGLWSDTDGHPVTGTFHEERLAMGGAGASRSRFDASKSGDFENFTPGSNDDDPLAFTIASDQVNAIRWMRSARDLLIGTLGAEFRAGTDSVNSPLTPSNINVKRTTAHGVAFMPPATVNNVLLFIQRHGLKLRELVFRFDLDGYRAPDLTVASDHVSAGGIVRMAYTQEPRTILWAARTDGVLLGFTYQRDEEVLAWHRHPLGGAAAAAEALAALPAAGFDRLWLIVKRTVDGGTKRYIEYMEQPLSNGEAQETAFYVDSGLSSDNTVDATLTPGATSGTGVTFTAGSSVFVAGDVGRKILYRYRSGTDELGFAEYARASATIKTFVSGTEVTADIHTDFPSTDAIAAGQWRMTVNSLSGLDHLEGETVKVLGDGAVQADKTVSGGAITPDTPAAEFAVGLAYATTIKTRRIEAAGEFGPSQTRRRRNVHAGIRLHRSLGLEYGHDPDALETLPFRKAADKMDVATPLFTGDRMVSFQGPWDRDDAIYLRQDQPLPLTVLGVTAEIEVSPT